MDNKITKKRISRHLEYDWYKYLLIIVLSIALCSYGFYMLNRTRDYEKLDIFISCYKSNESTFASDFYQTIKAEGGDWMREINLTVSNYATNEYYQEQQSATTGDILILPKSYMDGQGWDYLELTDAVINHIFTSLVGESDNYDFTAFKSNPDNFYTYEYNEAEGKIMEFANGKRYGIRVDHLLKMDSASPPFVFDYKLIDAEDTQNTETEFYMVFSKKSIKIGPYGANSNYHNLNQAFRFARYFIGKYNQ